jgi:hypothetical protein
MNKIQAGDKVIRDADTAYLGDVRLGDTAPAFGPAKIRLGDKVIRDAETKNLGAVRVGDTAPAFSPKK